MAVSPRDVVLEMVDGFKVIHDLDDNTVTLTVHVGACSVYTTKASSVDEAWENISKKLVDKLTQ